MVDKGFSNFARDLKTDDALAINIPALIPLPETSARVK